MGQKSRALFCFFTKMSYFWSERIRCHHHIGCRQTQPKQNQDNNYGKENNTGKF